MGIEYAIIPFLILRTALTHLLALGFLLTMSLLGFISSFLLLPARKGSHLRKLTGKTCCGLVGLGTRKMRMKIVDWDWVLCWVGLTTKLVTIVAQGRHVLSIVDVLLLCIVLSVFALDAESTTQSPLAQHLFVMEKGTFTVAAVIIDSFVVCDILGLFGFSQVPVFAVVLAARSLYFHHQTAAVLGRHPWQWLLDDLLTEENLCLKLCLYWVASIAAAVVLAAQSERLGLPRICARKIFHFLAVVMFAPPLLYHEGILLPFLALSFAVALCAFALLELCRCYYLRSQPLMKMVTNYFQLFLDDRDANGSKGGVVLSHVYLLVACALPVWIWSYFLVHDEELFWWLGQRDLLPFSRPPVLWNLIPFMGLISVGVGDSLAAIIGSQWGKLKWPIWGASRTVEGTLAFVISSAAVSIGVLWLQGVAVTVCDLVQVIWLAVVLGATEAVTSLNDNVVLPLTGIVCLVLTSVLFTSA